MGAFSVVLETISSGISTLPFSTFVAMMQPIHLAIGIVEGLVTASVVSFVYKARPEIMQSALEARQIGNQPVRHVALAFFAVAMVTGGIVSWFASKNPDGLEWSVTKVTGQRGAEGAGARSVRHTGIPAGKNRLPAGLFIQETGGSEERRITAGSDSSASSSSMCAEA